MGPDFLCEYIITIIYSKEKRDLYGAGPEHTSAGKCFELGAEKPHLLNPVSKSQREIFELPKIPVPG